MARSSEVFKAVELAARWRVCIPTVYAWAAKGLLPRPLRLGTSHVLRWSRESILEWEARGGISGALDGRRVADAIIRPLLSAAFACWEPAELKRTLRDYSTGRAACAEDPDALAAFAADQFEHLLAPMLARAPHPIPQDAALTAVAVLGVIFGQGSPYLGHLLPAFGSAIAIHGEALEYLKGLTTRVHSDLVLRQAALPSFWGREAAELFGPIGRAAIDDRVYGALIDDIAAGIEAASPVTPPRSAPRK